MFVRVVLTLTRVGFVSALLAALLTGPAAAAEVGTLKCRFNGVDAAVHFGAKRTLECVFKQKHKRRPDRYVGILEKFGIEVGIIGRRHLVWRVRSHKAKRLRRGALAGTYRGVIAEASVGAGFAATILTGGPSRSYAFHPLAFQKVEGLSVAAGVIVFTLKRKR